MNRQRLRRVALIAAAVIFLPYLYSRAIAPSNRIRVFGPSTPTVDAVRDLDQLKIVTYNIAHARGLAESNWVGDRLGRLSEIAELLKAIDADVVVLNEVDFDCSWSGGVNQAAWLAKNSGYPYHVEERNLDFRVLLWRWRFGNAILSKHPISDTRIIDLPAFATWESMLVGKKRALACTVKSGEHNVRVIGAHLSPRSGSLRVQSCKIIMDATRATDLPCVVAGDFNSAPVGFPIHQTDSSGGNAIDAMDASGVYLRLPTDLPNENGFTFPANAPDRVIDWIFATKPISCTNYAVTPSKLSDHRPVQATLKVSSR